MKIVIVSTSDINGGAARAAYRLHKSLLANNVDSLMIVQEKLTDDFTVLGPKTKLQKYFNLLRPAIDQLPTLLYKNRNKTLFSPASFGFSNIVKIINELQPDIVHLHWICGGMLKIEDIARIKAPVVWSLHDNWAFTGGCHIKWQCDKFLQKCGKCPVLGSNSTNDLSHRIWKRKNKIFSQKDFIINGLSSWITNLSQKSSLLGKHKHTNLPNPIDTSVFKPIDKLMARHILNLPTDKRLVLFGALSATSDRNKGYPELVDALSRIKSTDIELVVVGASRPQKPIFEKFKTHFLGRFNDDTSMVLAFNAADITVVPSLQENLSNVIMESLACATPVVAFDTGGNRDMIDHFKNGFLAKPFDTIDFATGIDWLLNNTDIDAIKQQARQKVLNQFDSNIVAKQYIDLYNEIMQSKAI